MAATSETKGSCSHFENADRDLVTFAIFCYNQAATVHAAIEAALAQDYSPIEILISDDFSQDGTAEVIKKSIESLGKTHALSFIQNPRNLGLAMHLNKVIRQAQGSLVVLAAGDDISEANRVSTIVKAWRANGGGTMYISSDAVAFSDQLGCLSTSMQKGRRPDSLAKLVSGDAMPWGATEACTRDLITEVGDIPSNVKNEDWVLPFRAGLIGKIVYIDEPLVRYRLSENSISQANQLSDARREQKRKADYHAGLVVAAIAMLDDLKRTREMNITQRSLEEETELRHLLQTRIQDLAMMRDYYESRFQGGMSSYLTFLWKHNLRLTRFVGIAFGDRLSARNSQGLLSRAWPFFGR